MIEIKRSALVGFSPAQMFDLVNDVEAYPKRFSWCVGADVSQHDETSLTAQLDLRFAGMRHSFSTCNTLQRPQRIDMQLAGGPLRTLHGVWTFELLGDDGCRIELDLQFAFSNKLVGAALRGAFRGLADRLVDDFCAQAAVVYA